MSFEPLNLVNMYIFEQLRELCTQSPMKDSHRPFEGENSYHLYFMRVWPLVTLCDTVLENIPLAFNH